MDEDKAKKRKAYQNEWKKENTVLVSVRLFKSTDADITLAVADAKAKGIPASTELKRLIRLGIEKDQEGKNEKRKPCLTVGLFTFGGKRK